MNIGKISRSAVLPNIDFGSSLKKTQENKKPEISFDNKSLTVANSSEELIMAVQTKKADEKKPEKSKSEHTTNLLKRVSKIDQIRKLSEELDSHDKQEKITQHIKQLIKKSDKQVLNFVADAVNNGVEPAIILLSLKGLEKGDYSLSEKDKSSLEKISNELLSEQRHLTSISVSFSGAKIASEYFEDKDLAAQLRVIIGKGNYEKLSSNKILLTLMEISSEDKYDSLIKAYRDILSVDVEKKIPSTKISYLIDKSSRLGEISKVTSLMTMSDKMLNNIFEKYGIEVSKMDIAKSVLEYSDFFSGNKKINSNKAQDKIDDLMIGIVKIGNDKKLYAANQFYNIEKNISMGHWEKTEERNSALDQLLIYSSRHSSPAVQGLQKINKAFLNKF